MSLSQQQLEEKVISLEKEMNQVKKILSINVKKIRSLVGRNSGNIC
ncbi:MAG: hypothetical protein ACKPEZ_08505 [Planktothrix sp.]